MQPRPFPLHPAVLPRSIQPARSEATEGDAQSLGGLSEPLVGPHNEPDSLAASIRGETVAWGPAITWAAGALGAGLLQGAIAVSARPDAGVAQLSTAGTAMAAGTWLYAKGVSEVVGAAMGGDQESRAGCLVAAGGYLGAILGVGLACVPVGPVRMAGVGLDVLASQALHQSLTHSFIEAEQALGRHETLREHGSRALEAAQTTVAGIALVALAGSAVLITNVSSLGPIEGAGAGLFCHALLGSSFSAYLGLRRWRRDRQAESPRRGWQSA